MQLLERARAVVQRLRGGCTGSTVDTATEIASSSSETRARRVIIAKRSPQYLLIDRAEELPCVLAALDDSSEVAVDTETTGLDPRRDRLRLLSLSLPTIDGGTFFYLLDAGAVDLAPVLERLAEHPL